MSQPKEGNETMKQKRSVHGGTDSYLAVEVSAWRLGQTGDGTELVNHELPEQAQGYGVYIRNPEAFHVEDFWIGAIGTKAPGSKDVWGSHEQTRAAAFQYADALADHLGCEVVSQLQR